MNNKDVYMSDIDDVINELDNYFTQYSNAANSKNIIF